MPGTRVADRAVPSAETLLPLTPVAFEILLALADGDRHGYFIMQEVERRSGGRVSLHPGTLYRALNRLHGEGLIEERPDTPAGAAEEPHGERRRYYRITSFGRDVAAAEADRLAGQLSAARLKNLVPRGHAR